MSYAVWKLLFGE